MRLGVRRMERRVGPHRLGLILSMIKCVSLPEIMVDSNGLLATDNLIEETKRRGMAIVHR